MNGKEGNVMELSNLIGYFKIKEWKEMKMNGMYVILFGSNMEGMEWNEIILQQYYDKRETSILK